MSAAARTPHERGCQSVIDTLVAPTTVPSSPESSNNTSSPPGPRKRRRSPGDIPLDERLLLSVGDAARLMSVSPRTAKRVAALHPQLTCLVHRRRLFLRAKLEAWLAAGGDGGRARR
jgi:hypothetical protein